jgi:predicted extracellular nuclease
MNIKSLPLCLILILLAACGESGTGVSTRASLSTARCYEESVSAGNLITTAMQEEYDLDIVFYPSDFLAADADADVRTGMSDADITAEIMPLYIFSNATTPFGFTYKRDSFMVGTVKGSSIRKFILNRCMERANVDFQVAGVEFDITVQGGINTGYYLSGQNGEKFDDNRYYKIALSEYLYYLFPGYRYRNSMENDFNELEGGTVTASTALRNYLKRAKDFSPLSRSRCRVRNVIGDTVAGTTPIYKIQGSTHLSPLRGRRVSTSGIITATGLTEFGDRVFYIQDQQGDNDPITSDAVFCFMPKGTHEAIDILTFNRGSSVLVKGVVCEDYTAEGLTRTSIRYITSVKLNSSGNTLPAAVRVGLNGDRTPPNRLLSTCNGDLNLREKLIMTDGIDFYESLEGMRCRLIDPVVTGMKGGKSDKNDPSSYINLAVRLRGCESTHQLTSAGGIIIDVAANDYNPEVVKIVDNDFFPGSWNYASNGYDISSVFNVGDDFSAFGRAVDGIMAFEMNNFGSGEYVFYPETVFGAGTSAVKPLASRPITTLVGDDNHLTVASYNVLNLSADSSDAKQMADIAESIVVNCKSPDIICLLEVQDNNGTLSTGWSAADRTLGNLITQIAGKGGPTYSSLNIDPVPHGEGGEAGGNIRVAYLYRADRVGFNRRGNAGPLDETIVLPGGSLSLNPGRVSPNAPSFKNTRRSLAAEFTFKGKKVILIGNHLKSKLGDGAMSGAIQPVSLGTEAKRTEQAAVVRAFVEQIMKKDPNANVVVLGDFNEFYAARPLRVLSEGILNGLMEELLPFEERYSYIFNGNSQGIDHIYVSAPMMRLQPQVDCPHINSLFMERISDHDPVVSRFNFSGN